MPAVAAETPAKNAICLDKKKRLDDIHEQDIEDCKAACEHLKAKNEADLVAIKAANNAKLEALKIANKSAKLAAEAIHQAQLVAINKNPTIINAAEVDSGESSLPPTLKGIDLILPGIPILEVAAI
jgi:hypothetical protein